MNPFHCPTQARHSTELVIVQVKFTVLRINETSENIQLVFKVGQKELENGFEALFDTSG
jgi:hypothetical protein